MKLLNLKLSVMINKCSPGGFTPVLFFFYKNTIETFLCFGKRGSFLFLFSTISFTYFAPLIFFPQWLLSEKVIVVMAQTLTPEKVSEAVYQQIPDLPLENNYVSLSSGQVVLENTFVARLVRYHQYIKARPTIYRLDWKLTLADYLRKNEMIDEQRYPGKSTLTQNPLENDRAVVEKLTMQQRDNLVNVLVSIYNPSVTTIPEEKPKTTPNNSPPTIILPTPGGADLLSP